MTESDKKLLLAELREVYDKLYGLQSIDMFGVLTSIQIIEAIETEPSLDELLERIPKKRGEEFLHYGTCNVEWPHKFYCWYSDEEWDNFTSYSCAWGETLEEAVQKLKALIDKR